MNTNFDLSVITQSDIFFENLKIKASDKLIDFSKKHTNIARFTGIPIALCSSLLRLAQSVSIIVEALIKGFANIVGSPFLNNCTFSKGVKQIFLQFPYHIITRAFLCAGIVFEIFTAIGMFISPTSALESRKKEAEDTKL